MLPDAKFQQNQRLVSNTVSPCRVGQHSVKGGAHLDPMRSLPPEQKSTVHIYLLFPALS